MYLYIEQVVNAMVVLYTFLCTIGTVMDELIGDQPSVNIAIPQLNPHPTNNMTNDQTGTRRKPQGYHQATTRTPLRVHVGPLSTTKSIHEQCISRYMGNNMGWDWYMYWICVRCNHVQGQW